MSRHWHIRSTRLGRGLRALCSTVPLFLIFATLFIVPPVANAQEAVPTISSDKSDYTPGETVIITGSNWQAGEAVDISVNDDIGQTWNHNSNPDPIADGSGFFTYSFQLPTSFVAIYTVTATGQLSGTATTTSTDAPLPASVSMVTWRTAPPSVDERDIQANNSNYQEGETVPFRLEAGTLAFRRSLHGTDLPGLSARLGGFGYTTLQPFNTAASRRRRGDLVNERAVLRRQHDCQCQRDGRLLFGGIECGSTKVDIVTFNVINASAQTYLLWGGRFASPLDAGVAGEERQFLDGRQPSDASGFARQDERHPARRSHPATYVTKVVDSGSATETMVFTVTGPNSYNLTQCVPSGQSSVDFIGLQSGSYTVTESNVAGYSFASGSEQTVRSAGTRHGHRDGGGRRSYERELHLPQRGGTGFIELRKSWVGPGGRRPCVSAPAQGVANRFPANRRERGSAGYDRCQAGRPAHLLRFRDRRACRLLVLARLL